MATSKKAMLKKYDLSGVHKGEVSIDQGLVALVANPQMVKDYLVALRANQRQWSASTQTRAEVNHSKRKPHAQKGTGNARQGFLGAPQFRGGGRVHSPRPKFDQTVKVNREQKRQVIRHFLGERIRDARACILEYVPQEEPKTKVLAQFLETLAFSGKRVLFLGEKGDESYLNLTKSLRNLPRVEFAYLSNLNGYALALCQELVILESALVELTETLGGKKV